MFDIYLFPLTCVLFAIGYALFVRFALLPVVFVSKLQNLVVISIYRRAVSIKTEPFVNTNDIIISLLYFLLWLGSLIEYLLEKRTISNLVLFAASKHLNYRISKYFSQGCGPGKEAWPAYAPRYSTYKVTF